MANFKIAADTLIKIEKGYNEDPDDAGGETKYGISKKSYPTVNIKNLTLADALSIYIKDFWEKYKIQEIKNDEIATNLFIAIVNIGNEAIVCMQKAINDYYTHYNHSFLNTDGIIGGVTLTALNGCTDINMLLAFFKIYLIQHYTSICLHNHGDIKYFFGWVKRVFYDKTF